MNFFEIEQLRIDLIEQLSRSSSSRGRLLLMESFLAKLFTADDNNLIESFVLEFADLFFSALSRYDPQCSPPSLNDEINITTKRLLYILQLHKKIEEYKIILFNFKFACKGIENILLGQSDNLIYRNKPYFPLVEKINNGRQIIIGALESVTISIAKSKSEDIFILIPSEIETNEILFQQVKLTFGLALDYTSKKVRKVFPHHKVIVSFDKKYGIYQGESLGSALIVAFIEELLTFYNAPVLIKILERLAISGGIDSKSNTLPIGAEIIQQKVEHLFYSGIKTFVVPSDDEYQAKLRLEELKKDFPSRDLKIIGIENIADLLDRRTLIDIKHQNPLVRLWKYIKKYWLVFFLLAVFTLGITIIAIREFDDNPAILDNEPGLLIVKNKEGKLLWTRKANQAGFSDDKARFQKVLDVNNDGKNEILTTLGNITNPDGAITANKVLCYDHLGNILWSYQFQDSVTSQKEILSRNYSVGIIIDTIIEHNKKLILVVSSNHESYSSAIFKLNILTGERVAGTLWNAGHIVSGKVYDFEKKGEKSLLFSFINNSYEKGGMGIIKIRNLSGACPATELYRLKSIPLADFDEYILFPNSDYSKYLKRRNSAPKGEAVHVVEDQKSILYLNAEGIGEHYISYYFDYNLKIKRTVIESNLRIQRDSLVVSGKLPLPLTDTPEFCKLMEDQILYWNGKEFVKRK